MILRMILAIPLQRSGGPLCCSHEAITGAGPLDQGTVEARADVLVYSTPPLEEPLEVTGPVRAVLYVGSDAPDTDFTRKLVDVYPDGKAYNLADGIHPNEKGHEIIAENVYKTIKDLL